MTTNQKTEQLRTGAVYLHGCLGVNWTRQMWISFIFKIRDSILD